jgi:hypothetical protein
MDDLEDIAAFRSPAFKPFLPNDSQVNPGVYGAELAYWLASRLAATGVVTSYPESEDWGWYIEYLPPSGSEFAVHCTNDDEEGTRWTLRLRRHPRKIFGRDKPPYREADALTAALRRVLESEPSISEMKWLYAVQDGPS